MHLRTYEKNGQEVFVHEMLTCFPNVSATSSVCLRYPRAIPTLNVLALLNTIVLREGLVFSFDGIRCGAAVGP